MKFAIFPLLGLFGIATASAQSKPGSITPLLFEATVTTEKATVDVPMPNGAKRRVYGTNTTRLINRDILEAMRIAALLDGNIAGWTLVRAADAANAGNLYAVKPGKTAVAVPANLLTQPAVQGTATTGSTIIPATGAQRPNLVRKIYATLNIQQGASSATGTRTLKFGTLPIGATNHIIATQVDVLTVNGKTATGNGIISGKYRMSRPGLGNLITFFPGATVP
jgi:hypothetical protein